MVKYVLVVWGLSDRWYQCVIEFEKRWYTTVIIDNLENGCLRNLRMIAQEIWYTPDFYEIDIREKMDVIEVLEKYEFESIVSFVNNISLDVLMDLTVVPIINFYQNETE